MRWQAGAGLCYSYLENVVTVTMTAGLPRCRAMAHYAMAIFSFSMNLLKDKARFPKYCYNKESTCVDVSYIYSWEGMFGNEIRRGYSN
jgi:hypothetical protein